MTDSLEDQAREQIRLGLEVLQKYEMESAEQDAIARALLGICLMLIQIDARLEQVVEGTFSR